MTNKEAIEILKRDRDLYRFNPMTGERVPMSKDCEDSANALDVAIAALEKQTEVAVYDQEEIHHNCTVQVLRNSVTGDVCLKNTEPGFTDFCVLGPCSQMKPSHADKIRQMSDEELAVLLEGCICPSAPCKKVVNRERQPDKKMCQSCWLDWLKREVESDA